jgi:GTPase SAR1 family protein
MKTLKMPIRSASHRNETESKQRLTSLIAPCFVSAWTDADYGIDAIVELGSLDPSQPAQKADAKVEGKCFAVQLKSQEKVKSKDGFLTYPVPVKKLNYWYEHTLPVMLVIYDLEGMGFYYRWIDSALISELDRTAPNWCTQKTCTIKVPSSNKLEQGLQATVRHYVWNWRGKSRRKLEPGSYFGLVSRSQTALAAFERIAAPFKFGSVGNSIDLLSENLRYSIYRLAITGPSRSGKSSILNALVGKVVSPTGVTQTTAVPIQVIPGGGDGVSIFFHDGTMKQEPYSVAAITAYASQKENRDNVKQVQLVSIATKNENLESGISIFDIPGLDDPDDTIVAYTVETIRKSNAIVFVIDGSVQAHGGFIFKSDFKRQLLEFTQTQDKVFLVVNKVDCLTHEQVQIVRDELNAALIKYDLKGRINPKIFYFSAEGRSVGAGLDSVGALREALWEFILGNDKHGIISLCHFVRELANVKKSFIQLLNARRMDNDRRVKLEASMQKVQKRVPTLEKLIQIRREKTKLYLRGQLEKRLEQAIRGLERWLKSIHIEKQLPDKEAVKKYLLNSTTRTIDLVNQEYAKEILHTREVVDEWFASNLDEVFELLNDVGARKVVEFQELEAFKMPPIDNSSAWGMGLIGAITGAVFWTNPLAMLAGGFLGLFGSLLTTRESRRERQIAKTLEQARKTYVPIFQKIRKGYDDHVIEHTGKIGAFATKKLGLFFGDIRSELSKLNVSITAKELEQYDLALAEIETFSEQLLEFDAELRSFQFI